jgi:hypothetical protein
VWWWLLIWTLLAIIAAAYLASRLWAVWGQFKELTAEVAHASDTVAGLQAHADRLGERGPEPELAVFGDPRQLRKERLTTRDALKEQRRARRAAKFPSWARH